MKPSLAFLIVTAMLISAPPGWADAALDDNDWIGLDMEIDESATRIGFLLSQDQQNNSTQSLYLLQTLTPASRIHVNISRDRLNHPQGVFNSEDFSAEFLLDLDTQWTAAAAYQFQGQTGELEIEQFALRAEYAPSPGYLTLQWSDGDASIYARDDLPARFDPGRNLRSDLSSLQLELGWWFDDFTLSAQYRHYDYQRDVTQLDTRPLLQLLVKPGVLAQSGLLVSQQSSVNLSMPIDRHLFAAHILSTTSALNHDTIRSLQLDWMHNLNAHFDALFFISRYQGSDPNWTLSAGLEWNG